MTDWTPPESDEAVSNSWSPPASDTVVKQPSRISKLAAAPAKPQGIMDRIKNAVIAPVAQRDKTQGEAWSKGFTGIPAEIGKEFGEAATAIGHDIMPQNVEDIKGNASAPFGPAGKIVMDALSAGMSPLTGALTSQVGRPVEQATGVRREITGNLLSSLVPLGGEAKLAKGAETVINGERFNMGSLSGNSLKNAKIYLQNNPGTNVLPSGVSRVAATSSPALAIKANNAAKSVSQLKDSARAAYKVSDQSGMRMTPQAIDGLKSGIDADLAAKGFHSKLMPRTQVAVDEIGKVAEAKQGATLQDIDVLRKITGHAASAPDKAERFMGRVVQDHIDNFVENLNSTHLSGPVDSKAINAISDARDLWTKASKGEIIENAISKAKLNSHNFSASGYENALRNQFRKIANNDRAMARFSPDEKAAIAKVATGGKVENGLRMLGKFAPHGVVSTAMGAGTGFMAGGPAGAVALPVIGEVARQAATALTARNAARASELVRGGDPAGITLLKSFGQVMPKTRALLNQNSLPMLRRAPAINALKQLSYQGQQQ